MTHLPEPRIDFGVSGRDILVLMAALHGTLDTGYEPTLRHIDHLHNRLERAREALRLEERAAEIRGALQA